MKKRLLTLTLCVLLALVSVLALASCDDDETAHTHAYKDTVTPATCTTGGYTTHTCDCGHSYTDTETPVAPHATTTKILRYPTTLVKGQQVISCSNCSYSAKEEINVVTSFTMPSVAEALATMLPQGSLVIDDCDSLPEISLSKFISKELPDEAPLGSVAPSPSLTEWHLALQLQNAAVTVENGNVTGTLAFDLLAYLEQGIDIPTPILSFAFYLVNEDISISIDDEASTNLKLSDKFYQAIAYMMDTTVEELRESYYLSSEAENYRPLMESIANALAGEFARLEIDMTGVMTILSFIGGDIVQAEVVGENTVYTVRLAAAIEALSTYGDKTIATILDECFGAGTATSLTSFLTKLPDMTIGDIADAAIALSENYNIDLDQVYAIINRAVYNSTGADFDFESELYNRYDKTLLSVLMGDSAQDPEQLKAAFTNIANALPVFTVSNWVHLTSCISDPECDHSMENCVLLPATLTAIAAILDDNVIAEVTVDAEGKVVALNAALAPFLAVSKTENDLVTITLSLPEKPIVCFTLDLSKAEEKTATLTVGELEMVDLVFVPGENSRSFNVELSLSIPTPAEDGAEGEMVLVDYLFSFDAQYDPENNASAYILYGSLNDHTVGFGVAFDPENFFVECIYDEDFELCLNLAKNPAAPEIMIQVECTSNAEEPFDNFNLSLFLAKTEDGFEVTLTDNLSEANLLEILYVTDAETGNASLSVSGMVNLTLTKTVEDDVITYALVNTATDTTLVSAEVGAGTLDLTFGFADCLTGGVSLSSPVTSGSLQFTVECKDLTIVSAKTYEEPIEADQESACYEVTEITTCVLDGILSFTITPAAN